MMESAAKTESPAKEPPATEPPAKKLKTDIGDSSDTNSKNDEATISEITKDEGAVSSSVSASEKTSEVASKTTPEKTSEVASKTIPEKSVDASDKNPSVANGIPSEKSDKNDKSNQESGLPKHLATFLEKHWHCALCVHVHRLEDESFDEHALQEDHKMMNDARLEQMRRDWGWRKKRRWVFHCSACHFHTNDKQSFKSHMEDKKHDANVKKVIESLVKAKETSAEGKGTDSGASKSGENKNTDPAKSNEPSKAPTSAAKSTTGKSGPLKKTGATVPVPGAPKRLANARPKRRGKKPSGVQKPKPGNPQNNNLNTKPSSSKPKPGGFNQNEGRQAKPGKPFVAHGPKQKPPGNPQGNPNRDRFSRNNFQNRSGNFSSPRPHQSSSGGGRSRFPEDRRDPAPPPDRSNRFGMEPQRNYVEVWSRERPGPSFGDIGRNSNPFSGIDSSVSSRNFSDIISRSGLPISLESASTSSFRNKIARLEESARMNAMMLDRMEFSRIEASRMDPALSRMDTSRMEQSLSRMDTSRMEPSLSRIDIARMELSRMQPSRMDMSRVETQRRELSRMEAPRSELLRNYRGWPHM